MTQYETAYQQAKGAALVVRHAQPGILRLTGKDRLSFLHRMSTNAIEAMPEGSLLATTLTTPLARIIDCLWLIARNDELLILTSPDREETVRAWLQKHIFFNDEVEVAAASPGWSLWGAYGPEAFQRIAAVAGTHAAPQAGQVIEASGGLVLGWDAPAGLRVLLTPQADTEATALWPEASQQVTADVFETLRIEAGQPAFGAEFDEDSIPLEVGLRTTVNFDKGCYTGQEIIARMDSRGQLARTLIGFYLQEQAEPDELVTETGQAAGRLTSSAYSPTFGWIGLGVVPTRHLGNGKDLYLASNHHKAEITQLPFQ